jgi:hypothetical protein
MQKSTSNTWVRGALTVFLALYGGLAAGGLPPFMKELFKNNIFKVFILALLAYIMSEDLQIGVMVTAAFLLTIVGINAMENKETFDQMHHMVTLETFDDGKIPPDSYLMQIPSESVILIPDNKGVPAFKHVSSMFPKSKPIDKPIIINPEIQKPLIHPPVLPGKPLDKPIIIKPEIQKPLIHPKQPVLMPGILKQEPIVLKQGPIVLKK